ncbi:MAG: hypothetical protein R2788_17640 [Saprospiraceae bacterium]
MDIKTFHKRFKALSVVEQDILKILSIAYENVPTHTFLNILKSSGVQRESGLPLSMDHLDRYREMLDAGGWLGKARSDEIGIAEKPVELVMRMAVIDPKFKIYARYIQKLLPYRDGMRPRSFKAGIRELRLALYDGSVPKVSEVVNALMAYYPSDFIAANFFDTFFEPFEPEWLNTFPVDIQNMALTQIMTKAVSLMEPVQEFENFLLQYEWLSDPKKKEYGHFLMDFLKSRQGKFEENRKLADSESFSGLQLLRKGTAAFFLGQNEFSLDAFEGGLKMLSKQGEVTKKGTHPSFYGLAHILAILKEKRSGYLEQANQLCMETEESAYDTILACLQIAILYQMNYVKDAESQIDFLPETALDWIFYAACCYWCDLSLTDKQVVELYRLFQRANDNGYQWMALEFATLISKFEQDENAATRYGIIASQIAESIGTQSTLHVLQKTEKWQRNLDALLQLKPKKSSGSKKSTKESRLIWLVNFNTGNIQPIEQTLGQGGWSKGRNVSLKRLKEATMKWLTDQDREAIAAIESYGYGYYGNHQELRFNYEKLVNALIGHPLLFLRKTERLVSNRWLKNQLIIEERDDYFEVKLPNRSAMMASCSLSKKRRPATSSLNMTTTTPTSTGLLDERSPCGTQKCQRQLIQAIGNISTFMTV